MLNNEGGYMAYLIHGHISYILEANSKRASDFPLIGRKPNEICQFKRKKTYGTKNSNQN